MNVGSLISALRWFIFVWIIAILSQGAAFAEESTLVEFDIDAQELGDALTEFGVQSGTEVYFVSADVAGAQAPRIEGKYSAIDVIQQLLGSSGVEYFIDGNGTLLVGTAYTAVNTPNQGGASDSKNSSPAPSLIAQNRTNQSRTDANVESNDKYDDTRPEAKDDEEPTSQQRGLAEFAIDNIIVTGSRNTGVRRFEDDAQPYVIFENTEIEASMSTDLEDFLRTRLPMNTLQTPLSLDQGSNAQVFGAQSSIDLRGLGTDQTLVLVNGRRLPARTRGGTDAGQPDINGIPLSAIERIEVLPSTASGIYGGGATGGVINVILKREYNGFEISGAYENTFDSNAERRRIDLTGGFALENGKTNVLVSASYSDGEDLLERDRGFAQKGRDLRARNNPDAFTSSFVGPLASTVNISSFFDGDLVLDDGTQLGSTRTFVPLGYAGPTTDGGQALVANAGLYNINLPTDAGGQQFSLIAVPERFSTSLYASRQFTDTVEGYLDLSYQKNDSERNMGFGASFATFLPGSAANNPFQNTIVVMVPLPNPQLRLPAKYGSEFKQGTIGTNIGIGGDWVAQIEYTYGESETISENYIFPIDIDFRNAVAAGTQDILFDANAFPLPTGVFAEVAPTSVSGPAVSTQGTFSARASGTGVDLPAGPVRFALLLEYRDDQIENTRRSSTGFFGTRSYSFAPTADQNTASAYAEALVPLFSDENGLLGVKELELQFAVRYDDVEANLPNIESEFLRLDSPDASIPPIPYNAAEYSSDSFTFGARYVPTDDVQFRVSAATGFIAPSLDDLRSPNVSDGLLRANIIDPKRGGVGGNNTLVVERVSGGNPQVEPETSESLSFGIVLTPRVVPGLRISVDYTKIEKEDEVIRPTENDVLAYEDELPGRVVRAPLSPEDEAQGFTGGEVVYMDTSALNFSTTDVEALDFQIDYSFESARLGLLDIFVVATHQTELGSRIVPDAAIDDTVGFANGPLEWRGNAGVRWEKGPFTLGWNTQYYGDYKVYRSSASEDQIDTAVLDQGSHTIPDQIYHDIFMVIRPDNFGPESSGFMNGLEVRLGIQNMFDEEPPVIATAAAFGGYSTYGDPRLRRYSLQLTKRF